MDAKTAYMAEFRKAAKMVENLKDMFDSAVEPDRINWATVGSMHEFTMLLEYARTQLPEQVATATGEMVPNVYGCPQCGERRIDMLHLQNDEVDEMQEINCLNCHAVYLLP